VAAVHARRPFVQAAGGVRSALVGGGAGCARRQVGGADSSVDVRQVAMQPSRTLVVVRARGARRFVGLAVRAITVKRRDAILVRIAPGLGGVTQLGAHGKAVRAFVHFERSATRVSGARGVGSATGTDLASLHAFELDRVAEQARRALDVVVAWYRIVGIVVRAHFARPRFFGAASGVTVVIEVAVGVRRARIVRQPTGDRKSAG